MENVILTSDEKRNGLPKIEGEIEKQEYDTKYRLFLSEKDEYVPASHVGMYSLFRNPDNSSIYMSEINCQIIRHKTYNSTMELFRKYESPNYCAFFNYNADILTRLGKNYFATQNKFSPIAELVECFAKTVTTPNGAFAIAISYGIEKITLKYYLESVKKSTDFWSNPPISVIKRKKLEAQKRDFIIFDEEEMQMDYWNSIHLPRNPLYHQFLDWCKLQGMEPYEGMQMALECLLSTYPAEGLQNITEYDYIGELDVPLYAKPRELSRRIKRTIVFSGKICALADKIIERYNRDPENTAKRIDFDLYCNNALHLLNQSMDLQYRDPDLYAEEIEFEEAKRYNTALIKAEDGENENANSP